MLTVYGQQPSFLLSQLNNSRVSEAYRLCNDSLKRQFHALHLSFPPRQVYLRSFKYDSELEVWVRQRSEDPFKLFKTYHVCAMSGVLGPKRIEGDYQVPEGFYAISSFNPHSNYHLALGVSYPNASDNLLSDSSHPGGGIYIHGNCVTVGCIPIQDNPIDEVYLLCSYAHSLGQDFIPVHIFPVRFGNLKSLIYLNRYTQSNPQYNGFFKRLKDVYDYFNLHNQLPLIGIDDQGRYEILH